MPLDANVRYILERHGLKIPSHKRSLWVHGETPLQFDAARQLIRAIMAERPHVRLVATSQRLRTLEFLRSTFVDDQTLPAPYGVGPVLQRFLRKLQVRHILLLDGGRSFPSGAIHAAVSQRIPVTAVNIGNPATLDRDLLEAARRCPQFLKLSVFDEAVAQELQSMGLQPATIAITGCLDLDASRSSLWPAGTASRRLLHLQKDTPVLAALDLPREEERLVFDAFAKVRRGRPDSKMIIEPRLPGQLALLTSEIERRGWIAETRLRNQSISNPHWDILLSASPGELTALLPITVVAIIGGTFTATGNGAPIAAAISSGTRALVGPHREFDDVPWQFLRTFSLVQAVEAQELATVLTKAVQSSTTGSESAPTCLSAVSKRTYAAISGRLPDNPQLPNVAQDWKVPTLRERGGSSRVWRFVAPALMRNRIDTWEDLSSRLRRPRSVLCLGNGPSSEDPEIAGFEHDCLIRVNWRWKARGFLVNPQVVFVGDPATLHKVDDTVFGLWNTRLEYGMLLRHLITHGPVPMKYFTMGRISPIVRDRSWPARPTNGALMIAAGASLAPDRLMIAGVDLFLHPDGRYPGDALSNNQYASVHSREIDLAIIRSALAQYRGELVILGDPLRRALEVSRVVSNGSR